MGSLTGGIPPPPRLINPLTKTPVFDIFAVDEMKDCRGVL